MSRPMNRLLAWLFAALTTLGSVGLVHATSTDDPPPDSASSPSQDQAQ